MKTNSTMKYEIKTTNRFDKDLKKARKQGKNIQKLYDIVDKLANGEKLDFKYRNHSLIDDSVFKNCYECHIEPDWLLIYKYDHDKLILLLFSTGSHSELFK